MSNKLTPDQIVQVYRKCRIKRFFKYLVFDTAILLFNLWSIYIADAKGVAPLFTPMVGIIEIPLSLFLVGHSFSGVNVTLPKNTNPHTSFYEVLTMVLGFAPAYIALTLPPVAKDSANAMDGLNPITALLVTLVLILVVIPFYLYIMAQRPVLSSGDEGLSPADISEIKRTAELGGVDVSKAPGVLLDSKAKDMTPVDWIRVSDAAKLGGVDITKGKR